VTSGTRSAVFLVVGSLTALLCACGGSGGDPDAVGSRASASIPPLHHALATARHVYANEVRGGRVHHDWRLVASDTALLEALSRGEFAAAQAEARAVMTGNRTLHFTRITVISGGRAVVNAVWNANGTFVVAPLGRGIAFHGRPLGTLLVSVQDVVGFVKLAHKFTGAQIVVRGSSGQLRASSTALAGPALPRSGPVRIAGHRYETASFQARGWPGETLMVYVLEPV
jgi:hypothetical protein